MELSEYKKTVSNVSAFSGIKVELVDHASSEGAYKAIYAHIQNGTETVMEPVIVCRTPVDPTTQEVGRLYRDLMLLEWVCRYINTGGDLSSMAAALASLCQKLNLNEFTGSELIFLGYEFNPPESTMLPDGEEYNAFSYYVTHADWDQILFIHEDTGIQWLDLEDAQHAIRR